MVTLHEGKQFIINNDHIASAEEAAQLSEEAKQQNRAVPWRMIKDTRNFYVHSYGAIDLPAVWKTLCEDPPELKSACVQMIESANS